MNTFKKALLVAGVLGLGSAVAAPAFAGGNCCGAYISGSSAIVLMDGASQSVGVEMSLPNGVYFPGVANVGDVVVTPVLSVPGTAAAQTGLATNGNSFATLQVAAGAPNSTSQLAGGTASFTAAAAAKLTAATDIADITSIIRAGAGVNGLD